MENVILLSEKSIPYKTVSDKSRHRNGAGTLVEQMGHNDCRVNLNTYAHLKQEVKIHAADVISKLFQ